MESREQLLEMEDAKNNLEYYQYLRKLVQQSDICYWIGNPSVEIINGSINLLPFVRDNTQSQNQFSGEQDEENDELKLKTAIEQSQTLEDYVQFLQKYCKNHLNRKRSKQLALCGIPNTKTPIAAAEILRPYFKWIQQIRVIKTVDLNYYGLLILMRTQKASQIMFTQLFGTQYHPLEIQRAVLRQMGDISLCFSQLMKQQGMTNQMKLLREIKNQTGKLPPKYIFMSTHRDKLFSSSKKEKEKIVRVCQSPVRQRFHSQDHGGYYQQHSPSSIQKTNSISGQSVNTHTNRQIIICTICFEEPSSQLFSILCGHYFDWECLQRWQENICPLCRFHQQPPVIKFCEQCNQCQGLWICLICGIRLCCGHENNILSNGSHIYKHYLQTNHSLSMELQTKFLFDARVPAFLHRKFLRQIQENIRSERQNMIQISPDKNKLSESKQHKKDKIRAQIQEYERQVTGQMQSQRQYFQETLAGMNKKHRQNTQILRQEAQQLRLQVEELEQQEKSLQNHKQQISKQLTKYEKQLQIVNNLQKMLEKKISARKSKTQQYHQTKKQALEQLELQLYEKKQQLRDYQQNIQFKQKVKSKLKGQTVMAEMMLGGEKKPKKKK